MKHKVLTFDEVQSLKGTTWRVGILNGLTYQNLIDKLGEPTFNNAEDGKTNFEWVVKFNDCIYSIYDWHKEREYALTELTEWNISGTTNPLNVIDFIEYIKNL